MKSFFYKVVAVTIVLSFFFSFAVKADATYAASNEVNKTFNFVCSGEIDDDLNLPFPLPVDHLELETAIGIHMTTSSSVHPNQEVYAENTYLTVAIDLGEDIASLLGGIGGTHILGELTTFNISSQNKDLTINLADPVIDIPNTPIPADGLVETRIPYDIGINAGPYEAGEDGELSFHLGDLATTFILPTGLGNVTLDAECVLSDDDTMITSIPIETLLDRINKAKTKDQMSTLIIEEEAGLDLGDFYNLTADEQEKVIQAIISERPDNGYTSMDDVQLVIDQMINILSQIDEGPFVPKGTWIHAEGAPNANVGNVGDLYLDKLTFDVYEKTEDGWVLIGNLQSGEEKQESKAEEKDKPKDQPDKKADEKGTTVTVKEDGDPKADVVTPTTQEDKGGKGSLPVTATTAYIYIALGLSALLLGSILVVLYRRKKQLTVQT